MQDKRFALLIDSDNISAKYISSILDEMSKYGILTYKRIYGDFTSSQAGKWKEELLRNSIIPIQQFSNTNGKNATDSALIIDAMDILYTKNVDGFCIVSSDSDFTRLASRLRESGMTIIGMGEEKTPRSFRAACTVFTGLEILLDLDEDDLGNPDTTEEVETNVKTTIANLKTNLKSQNEKQLCNAINKNVVELAIANIITENENKGKETGLSEIGSRLLIKYPDFDVRNYGYSLLSTFIKETANFQMIKENNKILVQNKDNKTEIINYMKNTIKQSGAKGIGIGQLSNKVYDRYPIFNLKDCGYSQFSKFVQSIEGIVVSNNNAIYKAIRTEKIMKEKVIRGKAVKEKAVREKDVREKAVKEKAVKEKDVKEKDVKE